MANLRIGAPFCSRFLKLSFILFSKTNYGGWDQRDNERLSATKDAGADVYRLVAAGLPCASLVACMKGADLAAM